MNKAPDTNLFAKDVRGSSFQASKLNQYSMVQNAYILYLQHLVFDGSFANRCATFNTLVRLFQRICTQTIQCCG